MNKPIALLHFHSDTNLSLFAESGGYFLADNYWTVDYGASKVEVFGGEPDNIETFKSKARDLGATIYD